MAQKSDAIEVRTASLRLAATIVEERCKEWPCRRRPRVPRSEGSGSLLVWSHRPHPGQRLIMYDWMWPIHRRVSRKFKTAKRSVKIRHLISREGLRGGGDMGKRKVGTRQSGDRIPKTKESKLHPYEIEIDAGSKALSSMSVGTPCMGLKLGKPEPGWLAA